MVDEYIVKIFGQKIIQYFGLSFIAQSVTWKSVIIPLYRNWLGNIIYHITLCIMVPLLGKVSG